MKAKAELKLSDFYNKFLTTLLQAVEEIKEQITEICCLGLGRIGSCKTAQYQLGLLLLLGEQFLCPCEVFDPVFSSVEKDILNKLQLKLAQTNCEGKKKSNIVGCTFFFFPHCPKELSNNLLYTNWNPSYLERCIVYANSFEKIRLDTPHRFLKSYHYLLHSLDIVEELSVPNIFRFPDIFNDLSLHLFPTRLNKHVDPSFWETPHPIYPEETELVSER